MFTTLKLAMNMYMFAVSKVLGSLYYNHNVNSGTETYVANLVLI